MLRALLLFLLAVVLVPFTGMATHNRAGEITYRHISGFKYEITVVTYTNDLSVAADRCFLEVKFGDGQSQEVYRTNGSSCTGGQNFCDHCGDILSGSQNVKVNIYRTTHTYPSTGKYIISMLDPNRNAGVLNIPNSVQVPFYLYSELNIFPDGVPNSSPILSNPPIDDACLRVLYEHNPGAIDYDITQNGKSDSLSYKLVICRGANGNEIPGYSFPDKVVPGPNNNISIDPVTGTLSWDSPQQIGLYNVAILIEEWRYISGAVIKMGSILRDLQITVDVCDNNNPPKIGKVNDTCITAGQFLARKVTAVDNDPLPDGNPQSVTLSATGDPFYVIGNKASFPKKKAVTTVSQNFTWSTQCQHIRAYPYFVVFRAEDNHPDVHLTDYQDWRINVVGPPPENINAEAIGAGINVTWAYSKCTNATGFRIYRKMDSIGYIAPQCVTGIPASTGYQFIGSTKGPAATSFFDDDSGQGLISGQRYCYMVYAYFEDGAESYPSFEACATLLKEVPIITRVSVNSTDLSTGSDTIKWAKPTELDMAKNPGPYQYKILRKEPGTDYVEVGVSIINNDLNLLDTIFVDNGLNTEEIQYTYRIVIYGKDDTLIGPSRPATSPWLKAKPLDNRLELSLNINVPWVNQTMYVYRQKADNSFAYLDSSDNSIIFTDSNLVNGKEYCYYVTTKGGYSDPELEFPLLNNSQIICAVPEDKQAPCPPQEFKVDSDCELFFNDLSWLNPNVTCDTTDDVLSYNIYYRPFNEGEMTVIQKVDGATNIQFLFSDLESVAGCYAITAIDSFNNESPMSDTICVDNCPVYELPNIITPGGDGVNDSFRPHYGWRYVKEVEMHIYNRWGEEIFFTTDPALGWGGTTKTGDLLPNGTYFYVCTVFEIRLEGITERNLKGTVTLLREEPGKPNN